MVTVLEGQLGFSGMLGGQQRGSQGKLSRKSEACPGSPKELDQMRQTQDKEGWRP